MEVIHIILGDQTTIIASLKYLVFIVHTIVSGKAIVFISSNLGCFLSARGNMHDHFDKYDDPLDGVCNVIMQISLVFLTSLGLIIPNWHAR